MDQNPPSPAPSYTPILPPSEAERRLVLLGKLQIVLAAHKLDSVLARNHRLVLHGDCNTWRLSGLTDPQLHIFAPDGTDIATTDGNTYKLANGDPYPGGDPAAVADFIRSHRSCQPGPDSRPDLTTDAPPGGRGGGDHRTV